MKIQNKSKNKVVVYCKKELKDAEIKAERDSIKLIEEYKKV